LINALEENLKKSIKRTKLIYSFDPLNKANFHKYFDHKCQIVLVIKTKAEVYIAAYSEGAFYPKMVSNKNGLLFSLTNH
jgi:type II secretory pathway predicted ATPase ExeA